MNQKFKTQKENSKLSKGNSAGSNAMGYFKNDTMEQLSSYRASRLTKSSASGELNYTWEL